MKTNVDFLLFSLPFILVGFFLIKNRFLGSLIIALGYAVGLSQFLSCKIINQNIDLFSLLRVDLDLLYMAPAVVKMLFVKVAILTMIVFLLICRKLMSDRCWNNICLFCKQKVCFWYKQYKEGRINKKTKACLAIVILAPVLFTNTAKAIQGICAEAKEYYAYALITRDDLFQRTGSREKYVYYSDVKATKGKNIVVIYCESLENGYFDRDMFPDLTPNLDRMKQTDLTTYTNYQNDFGAGWTIGALYATQTSFPCLFGHNGNDIFNRIEDTEIVSYAKVMKKAGYNNLFLSSANLDFSGTGKMMHMLGYELKRFNQYDVKMSKTSWGVQDADMFAQAKIEYSKMVESGRPFNLTLLTVDTHFPKGLPDKRLQNKIHIDMDKKPLEYCVASLDYLIFDFYEYMKSQPGFDNTVVVILGDHPVMGSADQTPVVNLLNTKKRNIALFCNSPAKRFSSTDELGYYDIANLVLDAAGIKRNAVFLDDMLQGDIKTQVKENASLYTHLNLKLNQ